VSADVIDKLREMSGDKLTLEDDVKGSNELNSSDKENENGDEMRDTIAEITEIENQETIPTVEKEIEEEVEFSEAHRKRKHPTLLGIIGSSFFLCVFLFGKPHWVENPRLLTLLGDCH